MSLDSFRQLTYKKMAEEESITSINQQRVTDEPLQEQPLFDVYELLLNRANKDERLFISGSDPTIPLQASLLKATELIIDWRLNWSESNFKKWVKAFEDGFVEFQTDSSSKLKELWTKQPWPGIEKANRPKIVEIKVHGNRKERPDFKVVQFFENRQNLQEWLIFSGSYSGIAAQIIHWWNQKSGAASRDRKGGELPYLKGQPLIKLYFFQDFDKVGKKANGTKKQPVKGEITFRIMGKSDNPTSSDVDKLSKGDLRTYAERIQEQFNNGNRYIWQKGRAVISYRNRPQGIECWYLVKNKAAGIELLTKILAVIGKPLDLKRVKYSVTEAEDKAYPLTPETITVLGEKLSTAQQRPIADVRFVRAEIVLPSLTKPIPLVEGGKVVYKI